MIPQSLSEIGFVFRFVLPKRDLAPGVHKPAQFCTILPGNPAAPTLTPQLLQNGVSPVTESRRPSLVHHACAARTALGMQIAYDLAAGRKTREQNQVSPPASAPRAVFDDASQHPSTPLKTKTQSQLVSRVLGAVVLLSHRVEIPPALRNAPRADPRFYAHALTDSQHRHSPARLRPEQHPPAAQLPPIQ